MNGWLLALIICIGLLGILCILRLGVRAAYYDGQLSVYFCINRLAIPLKKKGKDRKKVKAPKKVKKPKKEEKPVKKEKPEKPKRTLGEWLSLVQGIGGVAARLMKRIVIEHLEGCIRVGGQDAAAVAINYGRLWAAIGAVRGVLENAVTVRRFAVDAEADFASGKTRIEGRLQVSFRLIYILAAVFGLIRVLLKFSKAAGKKPKKKKADPQQEKETKESA